MRTTSEKIEKIPESNVTTVIADFLKTGKSYYFQINKNKDGTWTIFHFFNIDD